MAMIICSPVAHDAGQDVHLIIIGERHHGIGFGYIGFFQNILVQGAAMQNNGSVQLLGD